MAKLLCLLLGGKFNLPEGTGVERSDVPWSIRESYAEAAVKLAELGFE